MPAEQRLAERQRKTKPLLKSLESWLREKMKTLFFGSGHGGERGALLYSLIGTCKLNDVDPESYLRHVLGVIADTTPSVAEQEGQLIETEATGAPQKHHHTLNQ